MIRRRLLLSSLTAAFFCVLGYFLLPSGRSADLREANALLRTRPAAALTFAAAALADNPEDAGWLELAAAAAERTRDLTAAAGYLQRLHFIRPLTPERQLKLSSLLQQSGDLIAAEAFLRGLLDKDPSSEPANRALCTLLLAECRRYESLVPLRKLVELRSFLLDELAMLGSREDLLSDEPLIQAALQTSSRPLAIMSQASLALFLGRVQEALQLLQSTALPPVGQTEFVSLAARAFLAAEDQAGLADWTKRHAALLSEHPDGAAALGWLAWRGGRVSTARDHLLRAISLDANHRTALQLLGTILAASGENVLAAPLLQRAQQIHDLELQLHRVLEDDQTAQHLLRIADAMEQLERNAEAVAWYLAVAGLHPAEAAAARVRVEQLERSLKRQPALWERTGVQPQWLSPEIGAVSLADREPSGVLAGPGTVRTPDTSVAQPRFEDRSEQFGLRESWFYGQTSSEPRALSVLQGFGGGLAVLDFDGDAWPDLFVVQGNALPPIPDPRSADLLYRNIRGAVATQVRVDALPIDSDYGQGAAAGDFNEDGFTDLLVASTTGSRLLQNNGDGTFSDVSATALPVMAGWVTSCAVADVTGDGVPDIIELRYAGGDEIQTKLCSSGPGRLPRSCRPDLFPGAADRLLIGDGSGQFTVADAELFPEDAGRGLGVVIGDFDETGRNSIFVANDMTPNAFRVPELSADGRVMSLPDAASLRGCAVNAAGRIQAGMGIASGDLTGDGYCDFFVTNFLSETNTLYAGTGGGFFQDLSASTGAESGSLDLLSFGAQAIDANLDGLSDLFVLNGHVDDYQHFQLPWKMRPAAWVAAGPGRFQRVSDDVFGAQGSQPALGRSLAQLDWNRDGRCDLVATFLDRPPALYINETASVFVPLRVRLLGQRGCRRPVGAVLKLHADAVSGLPVQRSWATAGDGYYCSSEFAATLARPADSSAVHLTVRWPQRGEQQLVLDEEIGDVFLVEDRQQLYRVPD
ncbi:MAG: FG-GAP-like repeat-containing protein [Planctomycetaceae bacterium]